MDWLVNAVMDMVVPPASMVMLAFTWPTLSFLRSVEWALKTLTKEDMLDKVVVITGASSAIGEQIAYEYVWRNANLVLVAPREQRLFAIRDNVRQLGAGQVLVIAADVVKEDGAVVQLWEDGVRLGLLLAGLLVDRIGRKRSMGGMLLMCGAFMAPLSIQLGEGLVTTLLFCARTCIVGSFAVLYVYTPELYPASSRNTGVGITSSLGRIGSIVSPLVIVGLLESCHKKEAVFVIDLVLFLAGVTCALLPRETKGCQIQ